MTKKAVLSLDLHDVWQKQKALQVVSTLTGIENIDVKGKMTVVGTVDTVELVQRLHKKGFPETQLVSANPIKDGDEKEGNKKVVDDTQPANVRLAYPPYWSVPPPPPPRSPQTYYILDRPEEDPSSCVICGSTRRFPC